MSFPPPPPGPPSTGVPPVGAPPPTARRKSKAGLIVLAVLIPIVLLVLICGGVVGVIGYTSYQAEERKKAVASVRNSLNIPVGYHINQTNNTDLTFDVKYATYCTANNCPSVNPVRNAFNWLIVTGFTPGHEQNVTLCFKNGCTLTTSKYTKVDNVNLTVRLTLLQSTGEYAITLHGELPD